MNTKTIVQFGAGNIGRSLVGQLFSRAGYEVVFVDAVPAIIDALNARRRYNVVVKDERPAEIPVENVRGLLASDREAVAEAVSRADVIATAVGPNVLPKIFPNLAAGIARRARPVTVILCENLHGAPAFVRDGLRPLLPPGFDLGAMVGLAATSIGKMVPIMPAAVRDRDPLEVWAEAYNQIIADREAFIGVPPNVEGLVLKANFEAYVDRKLFIHNLGHAAAAYFGHLAGKTTTWECMADAAIRARAEAAMWESGRALIARYPTEFDEANQREHIEDLLRRFANRALGDTVFRVGRDLYRKLAANDRCIGALRLAAATGVETDAITRAIAAGLRFKAVDEQGEMFPDDRRFHARLAEIGPRGILTEVCGLNPSRESAWIETILAHYATLRPAPEPDLV